MYLMLNVPFEAERMPTTVIGVAVQTRDVKQA